MFKNANINSIEEAINRLIAKERFQRKEYVIFYDAYFITKGETPFRLIDRGIESYLESIPMPRNFILSYKNWEIECADEWYNNLGNGVLCWVNEEHTHIGLVTEYSGSAYFSFRNGNTIWEYAKPLTKEELLKFYYVE